MNIHVVRDSDTGKEVLGHMVVPDAHFGCYTLERPEKGNMNKISCIPKGTYSWVKVGATKNIPYEHISILNVPQRSGICIHIANYVKQIEGCIAVGTKLIDINGDGQMDTASSKVAFDKLMAVLPDAGTITIE